MISLKERKDMRRMDYRIKVVFERPNNIQFTKYFTRAAEADDFTVKAKEHGMQMIERCELYEK